MVDPYDFYVWYIIDQSRVTNFDVALAKKMTCDLYESLQAGVKHKVDKNHIVEQSIAILAVFQQRVKVPFNKGNHLIEKEWLDSLQDFKGGAFLFSDILVALI